MKKLHATMFSLLLRAIDTKTSVINSTNDFSVAMTKLRETYNLIRDFLEEVGDESENPS